MASLSVMRGQALPDNTSYNSHMHFRQPALSIFKVKFSISRASLLGEGEYTKVGGGDMPYRDSWCHFSSPWLRRQLSNSSIQIRFSDNMPPFRPLQKNLAPFHWEVNAKSSDTFLMSHRKTVTDIIHRIAAHDIQTYQTWSKSWSNLRYLSFADQETALLQSKSDQDLIRQPEPEYRNQNLTRNFYHDLVKSAGFDDL